MKSDQPLTWNDVGIPPALVKRLESMTGGHLDYIVLNRVFRFHVKEQYTYTCQSCGFIKKIYRPYEDYSSCQKCQRHNITASVGWRMGKDEVESYSCAQNGHSFTGIVVAKMKQLYQAYFKTALPPDFFTCNFDLSQDYFDGICSGMKEVDRSSSPQYIVKFCCGQEVKDRTLPYAVCKAAVLSPFLWDDQYDWKAGLHRGAHRESHILPLMETFNRSRRPQLEIKRQYKPPKISKMDMPMINYHHPMGYDAISVILLSNEIEAIAGMTNG